MLQQPAKPASIHFCGSTVVFELSASEAERHPPEGALLRPKSVASDGHLKMPTLLT